MWYSRVAVLAVLCLVFRVEVAPADSSRTAPADQAVDVLEHHDPRSHAVAPDDITREFEWLEKTRDAVFDNTAIDRLVNRWLSRADQLKAASGLHLGVAYTVLYQRLTDTRENHDPKQGAVGDLDIFGEWSPPGIARPSSGFFGFDIEFRSRLLTSSRPSDLGDSAGSLWQTSNDFDTQDVSLVQLWWQRAFANDAFSIRMGKVDQTDLFDVGSLKSADLFFTNFAFSENPAIASPDPGWGTAVHLDLDRGWYLITGFGDANARRTTLAANDFYDRNDYFTAAEFGLTPSIEGLGKGHYQLMVWHTDGSDSRNEPDQPSGKGFALRFEQRIGGHVLPFATYPGPRVVQRMCVNCLRRGWVLEAFLAATMVSSGQRLPGVSRKTDRCVTSMLPSCSTVCSSPAMFRLHRISSSSRNPREIAITTPSVCWVCEYG